MAPTLGSAALAIDIGASSVKSAIVTREPDWQLVERFDTMPVPVRTFASLSEVVIAAAKRAIAARPDLCRIGISTTGSVSPDNIVLSSGFYQGYERADWRRVLGDACGSRVEAVRVMTDGRAAAWGSYLADTRARGTNVAHFVVGSGVGGGLVVDGAPFNGTHHHAGAFGHIKVTPAPTPVCVCGGRGCVELFAAAPAVRRYAAARMPAGDAALANMHALARAARGGSEPAQDAFREAGRWLAIAIGAVANVVDPEFITVGGGVVAAADVTGDGSGGNWYVDAAAAAAPALVTPRIGEHLKVVAGSLLNDAALVGAAALAIAGD
jgi:glucokinase